MTHQSVLETIATMFIVSLAAPAGVAQCPYREYGWTSALGAEKFDQARGVAVDDEGNVYVVGTFTESIDFDPGRRKDNLKSKGEDDVYITSYDANGLYRWSRRLGGASYDFSSAISATGKTHVAIGGDFYGRIDFDPGKGKDRQRAVNKTHPDVFVTVFGRDGSYRWTRTFGGPSTDVAWTIATDEAADVVLGGSFNETADFDPGRRVDEHQAVGNNDAFVAKLSRVGSYQWARTWGGLSFDRTWQLATDAENNVVAVGEFRERVDFDPGPSEDYHVSAGDADVFVVKFGPDGSFHWARTVGGPGLDGRLSDVATDAVGNVYYVGSFHQVVDFDPGEGVDARESGGGADFFLSSLTPEGRYRWTQTLGDPGSSTAFGVEVTVNGTVVVTGTFTGQADFDPGKPRDERVSHGERDAFVTRYSTDGDYFSTDTFGGEGDEICFAIAVDKEANVVTCGAYDSSSADFDITSGADIRVNKGDFDLFITKHYCGPCEAVERHSPTVTKKKALLGEVRALVPGGRVTVACTPTDPPGDPLEARVDIDGENMGSYKLKKLKKGEYACAITEVRGADGKVVCDQPAGKRRVTVK